MQIVIELDEEEYNDFVNRGKDIPLPHLFGAVYHAVELPKGHGRLIDAYALIEHAWRDRLDSRELIVEMIENAPTIVTADKEEGELPEEEGDRQKTEWECEAENDD